MPLHKACSSCPSGRSMDRPFDSLELSLRLKLSADEVQSPLQALVDLYSAYKQLGLTHVAVDFRRDDLSHMLEVLDWVATELRPAVETVESVY